MVEGSQEIGAGEGWGAGGAGADLRAAAEGGRARRAPAGGRGIVVWLTSRTLLENSMWPLSACISCLPL